MKLLLAAINSQYIHSNPALYSLARCIERMPSPPAWQMREYSINLPRELVLRALYQEKPDVLAFSTYIWNIDYIGRLLGDLRRLLPQTLLLLGGPEVSGRPVQVLQQFPAVDGLLIGEGELLWPQLLTHLQAGEMRPQLAGIHWRGEQTTQSRPAPLVDLARLPFLYTQEDLAALKADRKIIYYESSRGCPYGCSFCCSAREPLRQRPWELVQEELPQLAAAGGQIKFVDRTFNADPQRAAQIIGLILQLYKPGLSWHFEISPYDLPAELLELMAQAPGGYLRLEAGVQSLHAPTLAAIHRGGNWQQASENIRKLLAGDNLHLHLDLIAGLPEETPASFAAAFAELHALQPHYLQLGFLKILPGSLLAAEAEERGLLYSDYPPYQVLATPTMTAEYLFALSTADKALNSYYNSGRFRQSLRLAGERWPGGALNLYLALGRAMEARGLGGLALPEKAALLAELLLPLDRTLFLDSLRLDWLSYNDHQPMPACLRHPADQKNSFYFQQTWCFNAAGQATATAGPCRLAFDWRQRLGATGRVPSRLITDC